MSVSASWHVMEFEQESERLDVLNDGGQAVCLWLLGCWWVERPFLLAGMRTEPFTPSQFQRCFTREWELSFKCLGISGVLGE